MCEYGQVCGVDTRIGRVYVCVSGGVSGSVKVGVCMCVCQSGELDGVWWVQVRGMGVHTVGTVGHSELRSIGQGIGVSKLRETG